MTGSTKIIRKNNGLKLPVMMIKGSANNVLRMNRSSVYATIV